MIKLFDEDMLIVPLGSLLLFVVLMVSGAIWGSHLESVALAEEAFTLSENDSGPVWVIAEISDNGIVALSDLNESRISISSRLVHTASNKQFSTLVRGDSVELGLRESRLDITRVNHAREPYESEE